MRRQLFVGASAVAVVVLFAGPSWTRDETPDPLAISMICSNESESAQAGATPDKPKAPPKMLPGFGDEAMAVTTKNPEAQRWFDYGLRLGWAFQHDATKVAFAEAARLDPDCAMCVWGQALAAGPTINFGIDATQKAEALTFAMRAQSMAANAPEKERLLIAAMVRRYSDGDEAYATAMTDIAARFPEDDDIAVLAADANMIRWKDEGLHRAVALLETVLKRDPDHAGAIHFYIHATEGVEEPAKAVPYAARLALAAPAASHLIHMPSHTWYRVGRYREAAFANLNAIDADKAWVQATGWDKSDFEVPYFGHNVRFALGGAMMAGEAGAALKIADRYAAQPEDVLAKSPWAQGSAGSAWFAWGRFGDPEKVLAMPEPGEKLAFLRAMRHYGRGEALARKGDAAGVRAEAAAIKVAGSRYMAAQLEIGREVLLGRADMLDGRYRQAQKHFRKAAGRQKQVFGDGGDPPTWWYPVRRSLAAALLADGHVNPALEEARAVLAKWPEDPMSLVVVARAEAALGRTAASDEAWTRAQAGWGGGPVKDVKLPAI